MFTKSKYDKILVISISEYYLNYRKFLDEFSGECGVSARILGNYEETKKIELNLKLIEAYMSTMFNSIVSIGNYTKTDYVKFVYDLCNERQERANKCLVDIDGFDEIIKSSSLREKALDMIKCNTKFLSELQIFFNNFDIQ